MNWDRQPNARQKMCGIDRRWQSAHMRGGLYQPESACVLLRLHPVPLLQEKMGAPWAHWSVEGNRFAPVAAYMKRTIRDVRQKVKEKLAVEVALAHTAAGKA
jgi:hypothetical protein